MGQFGHTLTSSPSPEESLKALVSNLLRNDPHISVDAAMKVFQDFGDTYEWVTREAVDATLNELKRSK